MRALFVRFCCLAVFYESGGAIAESPAPPRNEKLDLAVRSLPDQPWLKTNPNWWGDGRALLLYGDRVPSSDPLSYTVRPFAMIVAPEPGDDAEPVTIIADEAKLAVTDVGAGTNPVSAFASMARLRGPNGLALAATRLEVDWASKRVQVGTEAVISLPGLNFWTSGGIIDPLGKDLGLGLTAVGATADSPRVSERAEAAAPDGFDLEMLDVRIDAFRSGARDMWAAAAHLEVEDGAEEEIERATAKALKLTAKLKELRRQRDELSMRLGADDRAAAVGRQGPVPTSATPSGAGSPRQSADDAEAVAAKEMAEQFKTAIKELNGQLNELRKENAELKKAAPEPLPEIASPPAF